MSKISVISTVIITLILIQGCGYLSHPIMTINSVYVTRNSAYSRNSMIDEWEIDNPFLSQEIQILQVKQIPIPTEKYASIEKAIKERDNTASNIDYSSYIDSIIDARGAYRADESANYSHDDSSSQLLILAVEIRNTFYKPISGYIKVEFFDKYGVQLDNLYGWQPMVLESNQDEWFRFMAPKPLDEISKIKVMVRRKDKVETPFQK